MINKKFFYYKSLQVMLPVWCDQWDKIQFCLVHHHSIKLRHTVHTIFNSYGFKNWPQPPAVWEQKCAGYVIVQVLVSINQQSIQVPLGMGSVIRSNDSFYQDWPVIWLDPVTVFTRTGQITLQILYHIPSNFPKELWEVEGKKEHEQSSHFYYV